MIECNGICISAAELGLPYSAVAYPHPDCELHGQPMPLSPEQEEAIAAGAKCWCGSAVGVREPGDRDGLGCLADIWHDWHGRVQDADKVDETAYGLLAISRLAQGLDVPIDLEEGP